MAHGKLRIISGIWRRRQIRFDNRSDIRPTTDAARETLFNWLEGYSQGARCLDLFAGSGALGFEALSRGAEYVVFVDCMRINVGHLNSTCVSLDTRRCEVIQSDALAYLKHCRQKFDIVFLDPPFFRGLVQKSAAMLNQTNCLNPGAHIYAEKEKSEEAFELPDTWNARKEYRTSNRSHTLYQYAGGHGGSG